MTGRTEHPEAHAPLLRLLGLVSNRMAVDLMARLAAAGFDDQRFAFNAVFAHVPPEGIRLTELAQRAGMSKQAMSELVVDLERLGYLRRGADPDDGRARHIEFTERGWAAVHAALSSFDAMESEIAERIGPRRLAGLRRSLLDLLEPT